jgi:hypothetical protein
MSAPTSSKAILFGDAKVSHDKSDGYGLSAFVVGAVAGAAGDGRSCFALEGTLVYILVDVTLVCTPAKM